MLTRITRRTFLQLVPSAGVAILVPGCPKPSPGPGPEPTTEPSTCTDGPLDGVFAVLPCVDETGKVDVVGVDDLVIHALEDHRCFKLIDPSLRKTLIDEMALCAEDNPDREYFDCESFAQKGQLLGATRYVYTALIFFEPKVAGAELIAKIGNVGGVEAGVTYSAMTLASRIVDTATSEVLGSDTAHVLLPSAKAGIAANAGPVQIAAMVMRKQPMGEKFDRVLRESVARMAASLRA